MDEVAILIFPQQCFLNIVFCIAWVNIHKNFLPHSYKCLMPILQTSLKLALDFLQPSYNFDTICMNFLQTSYLLLTDVFRNFLCYSFELLTRLFQTSYGLLTNSLWSFLYALFKLFIKFLMTSYKTFTSFLQMFNKRLMIFS